MALGAHQHKLAAKVLFLASFSLLDLVFINLERRMERSVQPILPLPVGPSAETGGKVNHLWAPPAGPMASFKPIKKKRKQRSLHTVPHGQCVD